MPTPSLEQVLHVHQDIFKPGLGKINGTSAKLHVKSEAIPKFCRARQVPYAIKPAVEAELNRLEAAGVITPINTSEWASPIVCVPKSDKSVRICGDYKVSINPHLVIDQYPLPKPQDLFTALSGGQKFTLLDMREAYQQMLLDEASQAYLVLNTHRGLYKVLRLVYGVASAPSIFQQTMDQMLQGLPGVCTYLDDIIITAANDKEHLETIQSFKPPE